jgi:hypothetical protein
MRRNAFTRPDRRSLPHSSGPQDWQAHKVNMVIRRIFGVSAFRSSTAARTPHRLPIEQIRHSLQTLLHDCKDMRTQRVIYQINIAQTAADLWLLRSDLHQCIAQLHNQTEAAKRINSLINVFEGWVPASQLARI